MSPNVVELELTSPSATQSILSGSLTRLKNLTRCNDSAPPSSNIEKARALPCEARESVPKSTLLFTWASRRRWVGGVGGLGGGDGGGTRGLKEKPVDGGGKSDK